MTSSFNVGTKGGGIIDLRMWVTVLREICVRATLDHNGVLRSNCATYHFAIVGQDEQERCDALADHYDWLARVSARSKAMKGASA